MKFPFLICDGKSTGKACPVFPGLSSHCFMHEARRTIRWIFS
ncbi:hypothetical protein HMPREF1545_02417 [Oscillibacter sp. KLE 1728]|nr:hypothetical protein HMPREF1545_02417 [Oscillibacter sp. KLE 1728]ERK62129.1 hypothetical protein HMPREF1546_02806 [Oscillibacter sp. KLE 1745]